MGGALCRAIDVHSTEEITRIYQMSTLLPLIGADKPEVVLKTARLKRAEERYAMTLNEGLLYLVYDGSVDVLQKDEVVRSIRATKVPLVMSSTSNRSRRQRGSLSYSVRYDDDGMVQAEEIVIYCKSANEFVCRYSCHTTGDEVILKSTVGDRLVSHARTRYLVLPLKQLDDHSHTISALTSSDVVELLSSIPFFASIPRNKITLLTEMSTIRVYPSECIIFREDEGLSTQMFITLAGSLEVRSSRATQPLARLEAGSFFGEMSLLINIPRAATVKVLESCMLMSIEKDAFHSFLEKSPDIKLSVYNLLKERLVTKAMMSGVLPFFSSLPLPRLIQFSHELQIEDQIHKGDCILDDNLDEPKFGLLIYGALEICSQDLRRQSRISSVGSGENAPVFLTPGCYFGPFVFQRLGITRGRIVARSPAVVLGCSFELILQLFHEYPQVAAEANFAWLGERCDLASVLRYSVLTERFQTFLEAEHSDENFSFCLDVEKFREATAEERVQLVSYIRDSYIVPNAPKEVNLPATIRDSIVDKVKKLGPPDIIPTTLFDPAFDEIMRLMTKDSFPRFKKTQLFQTVVDKLDPHIHRRGSVLVEACQVFRESISLMRPGKVERLPSGHRLTRMLSTIKKTHDRAAAAAALSDSAMPNELTKTRSATRSNGSPD
ncbi:TPA: hypothetical protein N0F65_011856 [Lagenidium giganteum]|uniref:Cyclic nucleotide-binding domain-containing protein n=1 Tax=Lagenidium giganteum TaxID=4803 RepID=A0AAV2YL12_9STRA|nr:TPA: hypothetical protein N0F65_011856 [Lagenidium giganteum]